MYRILQSTHYSSTSLVRGFWDEIFWPSKPRTTEEPRTKEGHIKVDIDTKFELKQVNWWSYIGTVLLITDQLTLALNSFNLILIIFRWI